MLSILSYLFAGTLFGLGLILSGMVNPNKVIGFLDITGDWDPSLALVMVGAIAVFGLGRFVTRAQSKPLAAPSFSAPTEESIDRRLLIGSALFGVGWGIAGFCPGPALVSLVTLDGKVLAFVMAMIVTIAITRVLDERRRARAH
ncbi:MAG: YeeE/YedE family protein [Sandaracinaceae bacterium]|nr:YeeE/YedE family protein [Sandaracinaceae bacterium]